MSVEEIVGVDGTEFIFVGDSEDRLKQKKATYAADSEFRDYVNKQGDIIYILEKNLKKSL